MEKSNSGFAPGAERTPLSSWYGLVVMLAVGIYATIDRQIFILVAEPIRRELSLSDTQLGLLQGVGLALVSVVTTYPIAWFADRFDRRWVTAICIILWSCAVVACGFAPGFAMLLVAASLVGVGEAGAVPTTFAMIPDLFRPSSRLLANSIFSIGGRLSQAVAVLSTGFIVTWAPLLRPWLPAPLAALSDWRLGMLVAAVGMPVAVALVLSLPKAAGGMTRKEAVETPEGDPTEAEENRILPFYRRNWRMHFGFYFAYAVGYFGFSSVSTWIPIVAARYLHQPPAEAGVWLASLGLISACAGFGLGMILLNWLQPRVGIGLPMLAAAGSNFAGGMASVLIGFARDVNLLYVLWGVQATFLMAGTMVLPTIIQNMSPRHLRARVYAAGSITALAVGSLSPVAVGALSDAISGAPFALLTAAVVCSTIALVFSAILLWRLTPTYIRLAKVVEA